MVRGIGVEMVRVAGGGQHGFRLRRPRVHRRPFQWMVHGDGNRTRSLRRQQVRTTRSRSAGNARGEEQWGEAHERKCIAIEMSAWKEAHNRVRLEKRTMHDRIDHHNNRITLVPCLNIKAHTLSAIESILYYWNIPQKQTRIHRGFFGWGTST